VRVNQTLAKWRAGQQTVGGWLSLSNTHTAERLAHAGFDWLCVDLQHGLLDYRDLLHMLPAISTTQTTPFVRVSGNHASEIMKVLDAGAMGVIVPLVNDRNEALAAVSACQYPPEGTRSFGPIRAGLYAGQGYVAQANQEIACIVMIETRAGIENLESIVTTPGLGGVFVGPADLAFALGLPPLGDTEEPEHLGAISHILRVCKECSVPVGIYCSGLEFARKRLEMGFDFVSLNNDSGFMMQAVAQDLAVIRGVVPQASEPTGY
jgi:4-hydroxy-2-oxoheptanedioate aldolase